MSLEPNNPATDLMDDAQPTSDRSPAPVLLVGLFALMAFLGMIYLENHGGEFNRQVYGPYLSSNELASAQPVDLEGAARALGQKRFQAVCAACHQATGSGSAATGAPPLAGSDWVQAEGPNRIIRIVLNGVTGPIEVAGGHYGTATMVPLKDSFNDDEIAGILTYIRSEWGNKGDAVTPEEVAAIRKKTADRPGAWTAPELLKVTSKN